jgi:predicted kinase
VKIIIAKNSQQSPVGRAWVNGQKPSAVIIRGIPGSGKSTLASNLESSDWANCFHVEADQYWIRPDGQYDFNASKLSDAHNWCFNRFKNSLADDYIPIVSNTFVPISHMESYLDVVKDYKEDATVVIIECQDNFGSIHSVPEETLEKMRKNFQTDYSSLEKYGTIEYA